MANERLSWYRITKEDFARAESAGGIGQLSAEGKTWLEHRCHFLRKGVGPDPREGRAQRRRQLIKFKAAVDAFEQRRQNWKGALAERIALKKMVRPHLEALSASLTAVLNDIAFRPPKAKKPGRRTPGFAAFADVTKAAYEQAGGKVTFTQVEADPDEGTTRDWNSKYLDFVLELTRNVPDMNLPRDRKELGDKLEYHFRGRDRVTRRLERRRKSA